MKKTSVLIAASLCSSLCFAQLKVYQNGNHYKSTVSRKPDSQ